MATFVSGKDGKISWDGVSICTLTWSFAVEGNSTETPNSCTSGVITSVTGNLKYTGSFTGNWDSDTELTDTPPNVLPSNTAVTMLMYIGAKTISVSAKCTALRIESDVNGLVTYSVDWMGQAAPTYPA